MSLRVHPAWILSLVVVLPSCKRTSERTLRDTEGRTITARCDREGHCELSLKAGSSTATDKTALALWSPGRLVGVCDVTAGKAPDAPSDCRPIECDDDDSCPPAHGLPRGTCINRLCNEPANGLSVEDAVMLCLAGTGLGTTKPDRLAIALNCGSPCKVPAVCRQP